MRWARTSEACWAVRLSWIPAAIVVLPAVGIHISYLLAAAQGHVPWCLVYLDGCTSISSTGRRGPERYLFLSTVLPAAMLLPVYWRLNVVWLARLRGRSDPPDRGLLVFGLPSGLALMIYAVFLGAPGPEARLLRRIAVSTFFVGLYASQVVLTWQVIKLRSVVAVQDRQARLWTLIGFSTLVAAGVLWSILWMVVRDDFRDVEDAFAWSLTLVIFAHVLVVSGLWRQTGFDPRLGSVVGREHR